MKYRRILAILLCLGILLPCIPMPSAGTEASVKATDLKSEVERQIRAYADSIDQSDAVDTAALALAVHGMTKGGKKLSVGKSHALTAVLLNSELLQLLLVDTCSAAIKAMEQGHFSKLDYLDGAGVWEGEEKSYYTMRVCNAPETDPRAIELILTDPGYMNGRNAYDHGLDWMVGFADVDMCITRTKVAADTATYQVSLSVKDRFDFATS